MKTRLPLVTYMIIILLVLSGCSEKRVQADTPQNTAWLMKLAIDQGDYERFKELFAEGHREAVTKEQFQSFKDMAKANSEYRSYELIRFDNDNMLLIRLTPEKDRNGKYYIEHVIKISNDLKEIFE